MISTIVPSSVAYISNWLIFCRFSIKMDIALELEEDLYTKNVSDNVNVSENYYSGLYPHQIGALFFSLFCLVPNMLILYIICRHRLTSTIYWTITNWSILNSILIINFLPLTVVPGRLITTMALEFSADFGMTLLTFTSVLTTLFMFDFFIKSEKVCRYLTILVWTLIILTDVITVVVTNEEPYGAYITLISLQIIFLLSLLFFASRVVRSWIRPSSEESYRLRTRLCSTYLLCLFFVWITDFMAAVHIYYLFVTLISSIVIYLDGYVNLIVLIYFDPRIKRHFLQMFCKSGTYSDIKFDDQNSMEQMPWKGRLLSTEILIFSEIIHEQY